MAYVSSKAYKKYYAINKRIINHLNVFENLRRFFKTPAFTGTDIKLKEYLQALNFEEVIRFIVVMVVSAFDSYFTDIFSEKIILYIKKHGVNKDIIEHLSKAGVDHDFCVLKLLKKSERGRPQRTMRNKMDKYFSEIVTQNFDKIDELFKCFALLDFSTNVQSRMSNSRAKSIINSVLQRRHSIVHRADLNSFNRPRGITIKGFIYKFSVLESFVLEADKTISNRIN